MTVRVSSMHGMLKKKFEIQQSWYRRANEVLLLVSHSNHESFFSDVASGFHESTEVKEEVTGLRV